MLALIFTLAITAAPTDDDELLDTLAAWDEVTLSSCTIDLDSTEYTCPDDVTAPRVTWTVRCGADLGRFFLDKRDPIHGPAPYEEPGTVSASLFTRQGEYLHTRPVSFRSLWLQDVCISLTQNEVVRVTRGGNTGDATRYTPLLQEHARVRGKCAPLNVRNYLLATGRGFSTLIDRIDSRDEEDGLLRVIATGRSGVSGAEGTWSLLLDPDLAMLAKEAEFRLLDLDRVELRLTYGEVLDTAEAVVRAEANVWDRTFYRGKDLNDPNFAIQIQAFRPESDEAFIDSMVYDLEVAPPIPRRELDASRRRIVRIDGR